MRPGRLDRLVYVGPPDLGAREDILKIRTRTMRVGPDFDAGEIARMVRFLSFFLHWCWTDDGRRRDSLALR